MKNVIHFERFFYLDEPNIYMKFFLGQKHGLPAEARLPASSARSAVRGAKVRLGVTLIRSEWKNASGLRQFDTWNHSKSLANAPKTLEVVCNSTPKRTVHCAIDLGEIQHAFHLGWPTISPTYFKFFLNILKDDPMYTPDLLNRHRSQPNLIIIGVEN